MVRKICARESVMSQGNHPAFSPERQALRARHGRHSGYEESVIFGKKGGFSM
jgi:hypothetical protein